MKSLSRHSISGVECVYRIGDPSDESRAIPHSKRILVERLLTSSARSAQKREIHRAVLLQLVTGARPLLGGLADDPRGGDRDKNRADADD